MKQNRLFKTLFVLVLIVFGSIRMLAQEPYAVLSDNNTVLTFYYDDKKTERNGMDVGPFTYSYDENQQRENISSGWDENRENIIAVVFDTSFADCSSITSTAYWFYGFNKLSTIIGINNLKTTNVTNMESMFYGCSGLTSLDLSSFNTANVTDMSGMFFGCSGLTNLDVSNFNTSNVTNMGEMFNNCSGLTSLDVSNFNTEKVTNMHAMFSGCISLTSLDVSNFKTGNVTEMNHMFNSCVSLTSLDVSNFKIDNVTSMYWMFSGCEGLTSLDVSNFKTDNVTNMQFMFNGCSGLTSLDVSNFNTANVTDMVGMFEGCSGLTTLDVSNFNTSNVTVMIEMFSGCSGLTTLDLSNFNTSNVKYMYKMFSGCPALTTIYASDKWSTASVTKGNDMFTDCINLVGGAGTHFNPDHVDYTYARIDGGLNSQMPGYFTYKDAPVVGDAEPYAVLSDNNTVLTFYYDEHKAERNGMDVSDRGWLEQRESITNVVFDASFANCTTLTSTASWFYWCSNLATVTGISNLNTSNVVDMSNMFFGCSSLMSLDVSGFNTANVTNMQYMFNGCSALTDLDVSGFKTDNVTNMVSMFRGCSGLTTLNVSNFNTANVTDMREMFYFCSGLTTLDVSNFNTANVTEMWQMFSFCSGLTSLDVSNFNTSNVTNIWGMFHNCSSLTSLDVSGFKTDNVTIMNYMFFGCSGLTTLDVSNFNTSKVTNMGGMFHACSGLTSLDVSNFNTSSVTTMFNMFSDCSNLKAIYAGEGWSTTMVEDGSGMFSGCTNLIGGKGTHYDPDHIDHTYARIDGGPNSQTPGYFTRVGDQPWVDPNVGDAEPYAVLSKNDWEHILTFYYDDKKAERNGMGVGPFELTYNNLAQVYEVDGRGWTEHQSLITTVVFDDSFANCTTLTSTAYWFRECRQLTTVTGISNLKTDNVTNMSGMFDRCEKLTELDVTGFKTDKVTDMSGMFYECFALTNVDVSGFNTANVTNMTSMFYRCSGLTSLDVSGFNTANVTSMNSMFTGCSGLTSLDVSGFNTANVTNMGWMFTSCKNLTSLDVSGFKTDNVTGMFDMFSGCTGLTTLDLSGFNTANVTAMSNMFSWCTGLTSLDLSSFNTVNVTDMQRMFDSCSSLTSLDLSNFKTDSLTNMAYMFTDCTSLTSLDLSSFKTDNVMYVPYMFMGCSELHTIYVGSGWSTDAVTDGQEMFTGCTNLVGGAGTHFDPDHVDYTYARIDGGPNSQMPGYFTYKEAPVVTDAEPYAVLSDNNTVLTFYYDDKKEARNGMSVGPFESAEARGWNNMGWTIQTVVFDPSFADCNSITSTAFWFYELVQLQTITGLSYLKTDNVTRMAGMFSGRMTSIDLSNFNTAKVTDMSAMFGGCSSLTSIDLSGFNTENVTDMSGMFAHCGSLTSLDLSNFNTSNVVFMGYMFYGCSGLTSLDLSSFNTANVTNMSGMFQLCENLSHLNLSSFNTANVTDMSAMFVFCFALKDLDLSNFNTSNVTNLYGMFHNCISLTDLDLSSFNTANVTAMYDMFSACYKLTTVYASDRWSTASVTEGKDMFSECTDLVGGAGTHYDPDHTDYTYARIDGGPNSQMPGYFTYKEAPVVSDAEPYAVLSENNTVLTFYYDEHKEERNGMSVGPFENLGSNGVSTEWYGNRSTITTVVFDDSFANCTTLTSTAYWFYQLTKLTTIKGIQNLKTDNVNDINSMFFDCESLTSLDLSSLNLGNVTNMHQVFEGCTGLESIIFDGVNTENVTNMGDLFLNCSSLNTIDLSSFNTSKVTNMGYMFYRCTSLTTVYVSDSWTTANVTGSERMFERCYSIVGGKGTKFDENYIDATYARIDGGPDSQTPGYFTRVGDQPWIDPNVGDLEPYAVLSDNNTVLTFYYDTQKEQRNGMSVGPFPVSTSVRWDGHQADITKVVFDPSFGAYAELTSTTNWFRDCKALTTITGIEYLHTDDVTNMDYMFYNCSSLESLDVSHFKTDNVTNMFSLFYNCSRLSKIDVGGFNTSKVTHMGNLFYGCSNIESIDVSHFDTSASTSTSYMFAGCSKLTDIDISSFNTANVTDFRRMFYNCTSLASIQAGNAEIPAEEYANIGNPNLLVYVDEDRLAPEGIQNVVVNGMAKEIVLKDASGNNNWYCPQEFQAEKISYTRNFNQQTRIGYSRGWESLALPFDVQTITHQDKGAIAPFGSDASDLHFWLRRLTHSGLQAVQTIEANTPYIISMPNSYEYPERFNLSGQVTFAAENVTVPQSVGVIDESTEFIMAPAFQKMTIQPDIYALNVGEKREYYAAGSVFERNYRDVRPFEAYTMHKGTSPAPMYFIIGENTDDNTTDILEVRSQVEDGNGEWYDLQGRKLGSTFIATPHSQGENVQRSTLNKGVYIRNGRKTVVR